MYDCRGQRDAFLIDTPLYLSTHPFFPIDTPLSLSTHRGHPAPTGRGEGCGFPRAPPHHGYRVSPAFRGCCPVPTGRGEGRGSHRTPHPMVTGCPRYFERGSISKGGVCREGICREKRLICRHTGDTRCPRGAVKGAASPGPHHTMGTGFPRHVEDVGRCPRGAATGAAPSRTQAKRQYPAATFCLCRRAPWPYAARSTRPLWCR